MSTKVLTHGDLDAGGCVTVIKLFVDPEADVEWCDYNRIDDAVLEFIEKPTHDHLILADISPTFGVFEKLSAAVHKTPAPFTCHVIDHHKTRDWLGAVPRDWVTFDTSVSATELCAQRYGADASYKEFARVVTAYDLWQKKSPLRKASEGMNDLFWFLGRDEFVASAMENAMFNYDEKYQYIIEHLEAQRERTVYGVIKAQLGEHPEVYMSREGHTYLMVVASRYSSELASRILVEYPHVGFAVVVNVQFNKLELRARDGETDVGKIAAARGGGGHQAASGFVVKSFSDIAKDVAQALL
jgi:oligoribonuclease NrnB/cAMP/cGMP phosphodiesterase (DHH superfamily)